MVIRGENEAIKLSVGEICDVRPFRTDGVVTVDVCQEVKRKALGIVNSTIHA